MRIAVIGSKGTLGSALVRSWNEPEVRGNLPVDECFHFDLPDLNIVSRRFTIDSISEVEPDVIFNLASLQFIDWLESHPNTARSVHIQGTANLRETAKRTGALLVQVSCAEVFYSDAPEDAPHKEEDGANPESVYAKTKLDGERAASEAPDFLILRTSSLFGDVGELSAGNIADTLLKSSRRTQEIRVLNDRAIAPTYTLDFLRAARQLIHSGARGLFHLANRGSATPAQFAEELFRVAGLTRHKIIGIDSAQYGEIAPRSKNLLLNTDRFDRQEGTTPFRPWQEAVLEFMQRRQKIPSLL